HDGPGTRRERRTHQRRRTIPRRLRAARRCVVVERPWDLRRHRVTEGGSEIMPTVPIACAGFLFALLWFDLMFDVQVLRHRDADLPEPILSSIAAYYRRVTIDARPMGHAVGLVMAIGIVALVLQWIDGSVPRW